MLIEFRVKNYRSFAGEMVLSLVAGRGKELPENTFTVKGLRNLRLVRCAAIYGANGSGKSSLILAFVAFRAMILASAESRPAGLSSLPVVPFKLDPHTPLQPSEFELSFLLGGVRHQYGFAATSDRICEEWLTVYPKSKPQEWFHRRFDEGKVEWHWSKTHLKGDKSQLADRTRDDALFLSVASQWNHPQLKPIHHWLSACLRVFQKHDTGLNSTKNRILEDRDFRAWLTKMIRAADVGIDGVSARSSNPSPIVLPPPPSIFSPEMKEFINKRVNQINGVEIFMSRRILGANDQIDWALGDESSGTQRMFELLGPIREVLEEGAVFVIDELDTSLHPNITHEIVHLFNSPETNPNHAQLIFTTHDTTLLDPTLLRRDQIWFTQKDQIGATDLYSLQEYSPRIGEPLQKGYLVGRYGATPVLQRFGFSTSNDDSSE